MLPRHATPRHATPRHATPLHPGAAASWGRALTPEAVAMPPRAGPVRPVPGPGVERLVAVSDVSASTPAKAPPTPVGLAVEVAVLNLGLPTTDPYLDEPVRNEEATRET